MDIDLARRMIRAQFASSKPLEAMIPELKEQLEPEEYKTWLLAIAKVIAEGGFEIMNRAFAEHPELEAEVEAALKVRDRY